MNSVKSLRMFILLFSICCINIKLMKAQVNLIIASSETDSNLYYATRFLAPDPFIFLQIGDEKIMIMSELEIDRAKVQAKVDTVLSHSIYESEAKKKGVVDPKTIDVLNEFLHERRIKDLMVPADFAIRHALLLQKRGYAIIVKSDPFFEERLKKNEKEIGYIAETLHHAENAIDKAIGFIRDTVIKDGYLYSGEKAVTSEDIKRLIAVYLLETGFIAQHTIVSCGEDTVSPHTEGAGPLKADTPVIIDLFPRSMTNRYYADITRTVVKGRASHEVKEMYEAVLSAQGVAISLIRDGINGKEVHEAILKHFKSLGYESGEIKGRMQGFFHGTGHGVGLDVHEPPRISKRGDILQAGNVVTVEPGLYYSGIGGVRLEDMVIVQENGVKNLTRYPKTLEV